MVLSFTVIEPLLPFVLMFAGYLGISVYAQTYRYRQVSSTAQRQQTKWVIFGLMCAAANMVLWIFVSSTFPPDQPSLARAYFVLLIHPVLLLIGLLFPVCIAIAVMRYRLWNIDVIIRRTLIYSTLTLALGLVYVGSIVLLQQLVVPLTGGSEVAIVASTLVIAALFTPLRRRSQAMIDRRFYRRKYNAAKVLEAFGATARAATDLDQLTAAMLQVIDQTMQPEHIGLWLREIQPHAASE
jgi:hypothetical protein